MSNITRPISESAFDDSFPNIPAARPVRPEQIGPYRILGDLGAGGMGEVYKGERRTPIHQTVAIKIIKLGFDSREVIARFDSERQALARMDHAHIARVLDAGTTELGRPYFVMEYVPGAPITKFADDNKLPIRERLALFTQACDAINHAHTKAIIHRDVKPSNVLAYMHDGKPTVKVIDFGIAKALTGDRLTDQTFNTGAGGVVGTPYSMSPEQAEGSPDIDTRTDVYSLGVLLYELLTGAMPFDHDTLAKASFEELKRIIRDVEPPRPSTRISNFGPAATQIAGLRDMRVEQLQRDLKRELEWIPLKAMRKERGRRYASPLQLADDIANYLDGRPLLAGPESRVYRLRKYVTRNRGRLTAAAAMVALIVVGIALYVRGIRIEQRRTAAALVEVQKQKAEADRRRDEAEAVNRFLTDDVLSNAGPENLPDKPVRDVIVSKIIDPAASAVAVRFKDKPLIEAAIRSSLQSAYDAIGRADLGIPHATTALEIRRRMLGDDHPETLQSIVQLAGLLVETGHLDQAEKLFRQAVDRDRQILGGDHPATLTAVNGLAYVLREQGKFGEAEPLFRETLSRARRVLGEDHPNTLAASDNLALLLSAQGKLDEAEPLLRDGLARYRRVLGNDNPDTLASINNVAYLLQQQGKLDEAEPLYREALERRRRVLGDDDPRTLGSVNNMGYLLLARGKLDEAEPLFREALERRRRTLGDDHPDTITSIANMGHVLYAQGKLDQADPLMREALERRRRVLGDDHPDTLSSLSNIGGLLQAQGNLDRAEPLLREALNRRRQTIGNDHPDTLNSIDILANLLYTEGKLDEAKLLCAELYRRAAAAHVPPAIVGMYSFRYGRSLAKLGQYADAIEPLSTAHTRMKSAGLEKSAAMREIVSALINACERANRPDDAAHWRGVLTQLHAATRPAASQSRN